MTPLYEWAARWALPSQCVLELQQALGLEAPEIYLPSLAGKGESYVQSAVRLEAAGKGVILFRNNVGALQDKEGRQVRFGLGNDSKLINDVLKSGDLIGLRRELITQRHVGTFMGQFVSRECKPVGWRYTGKGRELAQANWLKLIVAHGGDAAFATGEGTL